MVFPRTFFENLGTLITKCKRTFFSGFFNLKKTSQSKKNSSKYINDFLQNLIHFEVIRKLSVIRKYLKVYI